MEQMQRRRQGFRQAIRRNDLDSRKKQARTQLTNDLDAARCKNFIYDLQVRDPASLFIELARYISNCQPAEKGPWATVCWEMLTALRFQNWRFGFKGLAHLMLTIFDQLGEKRCRMLPRHLIIQNLLEELEEAALHGFSSRDRLFEMAFQLCIYASEQSHFHINFSEEYAETIINNGHNDASIGSLQVLTIVLLNLQEGGLRSCLINKIKQLGRSLYKNLHLAQDRQLYLRVITTIGLHWYFDKWDNIIAEIILNEKQKLDFSLVLRFLSFQSEKGWIEYEMAQPFLLSCSQQFMRNQQINLFLKSIYNICYNESSSQLILTKAYLQFFSGKLHHFINYRSLTTVTELIILYIIQRIPQFESEFLDYALIIIKMGEMKLREVNNQHLMILCQYVMKEKRISEAELWQYIGADNFNNFWETYEMNNQDDL